MPDLVITKLNELYLRIEASKSIYYELSDKFSFTFPGYQYSPAYKSGQWDGKIKLFNTGNKTIYHGLLLDIVKFCKERGFTFDIDKSVVRAIDFKQDIEKFKGDVYEYTTMSVEGIYEYQIQAVEQCLLYNKALVLSPTGCMDELTEILVYIEDVPHKINLKTLESLVRNKVFPYIDTPSGKTKIVETYRKRGEGKHFIFSDGTHLKCADNHFMVIEDEWISAFKICKSGIKHINNKEIVEIVTLPSQEWVDFTIDAEHESYYHLGITHHNSGKSHIIYLLARFLLEHHEGDILISVPTTALCSQMIGDFDDYVSDGFIAEDNCHKIYSGQSKTTNKRIVVSTFQSLVNMPPEWFEKFSVFFCDEAHQADSKSITKIINNMTHAPIRLGFTGTLDGTKCSEIVLRGLFGPTVKTKRTIELMEDGVLAKLKIQANVLKYSKEDCKHVRKSCKQYDQEVKWILNNLTRNRFIVDSAMKATGNTLVLFHITEHGETLTKLAQEVAEQHGKEVFFVSGKIKTDEREVIRKLIEEKNNMVLFASYGVFSTGTNAKNIDYAIFAHPYKAKIRNLQSIGRSIRKNEGKEFATLIDIGDDLSINNKQNTVYKHFVERLKIYVAEEFDYNINEVHLNH